MEIQNKQVLTLTADEAKEAIIEGLRKKHGKKIIPAELNLSAVVVEYYVGSDDNDFEPSEITVTLPPAISKIEPAASAE